MWSLQYINGCSVLILKKETTKPTVCYMMPHMFSSCSLVTLQMSQFCLSYQKYYVGIACKMCQLQMLLCWKQYIGIKCKFQQDAYDIFQNFHLDFLYTYSLVYIQNCSFGIVTFEHSVRCQRTWWYDHIQSCFQIFGNFLWVKYKWKAHTTCLTLLNTTIQDGFPLIYSHWLLCARLTGQSI